jgi:acetyl-CoA carboxylase carboxyltransferase component
LKIFSAFQVLYGFRPKDENPARAGPVQFPKKGMVVEMSEKKELDRLGSARLETQKASAARERLQKLFDEGTFVELDAFVKNGTDASGVLTGYGEVEGATLFAFSQDASERGAAVCKAQAKKIVRLYEMAIKMGAPVVGIYDSKGADISEGNEMLAAYSKIVEKAASLSGVVPQVALVLGSCAGLGALAACSADFVVMSEKAELFLTPPAISKDRSDYGDAKAALASGTAQIVCEDEEKAIAAVRGLISLLPENNLSAAATFDFEAPADTSVLTGILDKLCDTALCDITKAIADEGSFTLLSNNFGKGAHTALVTLGGTTVGMVNTCGELDHNGAARIARFVSVCDSFQIPVVTMINTEGVKPSGADEMAGAVRDMARLAHVYAEATTPKIAVVTGSAIGSAYVALANADVVYAWPGAVISAMPVAAAVAFLEGEKITKDTTREQVQAQYCEGEGSAYRAAEGGFVQDIITPADTRDTLIRTLEMLANKRVTRLPKKHSNLPL